MRTCLSLARRYHSAIDSTEGRKFRLVGGSTDYKRFDPRAATETCLRRQTAKEELLGRDES